MALEMKAGCERCGALLRPSGPAVICSYECTFCVDCSTSMGGICPNCKGVLVPRPPRATKSEGPAD